MARSSSGMSRCRAARQITGSASPASGQCGWCSWPRCIRCAAGTASEPGAGSALARRGSVRLGPDDALGAWLAGERAGAGLAGGERDAAHSDAEVILDLGLELGVAA